VGHAALNPSRNEKGVIFIIVSVFLVLCMLASLLIQRKIAMITQVLKHETYHENGADAEYVAMARALEALQTAEAPSTPYLCAVTVTAGGVTSEFDVTYTKAGSQWKVEVESKVASIDACPTFF